jgi:hypothetical protein
LHIGGGTTSLPPLRFDSETLLTSPATGTLEWDGGEFYRTNLLVVVMPRGIACSIFLPSDVRTVLGARLKR